MVGITRARLTGPVFLLVTLITNAGDSEGNVYGADFLMDVRKLVEK